MQCEQGFKTASREWPTQEKIISEIKIEVVSNS